MSDRVWTSDFDWSAGKVRVRATGAEVRVTPGVLKDVAVWAAYFLPVWIRSRLRRRTGPSLWFGPEPARPWYLAGAAALWAGLPLVAHPADADVAFQFEDRTFGRAGAAGPDAVNGRCLDVGKSRVAATFETQFGYPLSIDPLTWVGAAVAKGEANGAHDGVVVHCPTPPQPGRVYQRLIDNVERGLATDLRTPFVDGRPVLVFIKQRPVAQRFANLNTRVRLTTPEAVFTPQEIEQLGRFARAMDLDWGGLDILRDRADGRLYVVDVNKTDMGPPLALPWCDKLRATALMAAALRRLVEARVR